MKKIRILTPIRGFLSQLFRMESNYFKFLEEEVKVYNVNSNIKQFISSIIRHKFFDFLGIVRINKVKGQELGFSYNKFVNYNSDYIIYLENPYALGHYSIDRFEGYIGKRIFNKHIGSENLKAIVFMSESCERVFFEKYALCTNIPKTSQIYPFIINSKYSFQELLSKKSKKIINFVFIASNFKLKGGNEIIEIFNILHKKYEDIHLTIITPIEKLGKKEYLQINDNSLINLVDFKLSKQELNSIYAKSHVILNPSRMDSFPLVLLEGMKYANVVIASDLFGVDEMVSHNENGFLLNPKYRFYNMDKTANPSVWNKRNKTILKDYVDHALVKEAVKYIEMLIDDKHMLKQFMKKSYNVANKGKFNSVLIQKQWEEFFDDNV